MNSRRRDLLQQSAALGAATIITPMAHASVNTDPSQAATVQRSGRNDFDYFIGQWAVAAQRLRHRGTEKKAWEAVAGTTRVRPLLQGAGNIDEDEFVLPGGTYIGGMLRLFDADKDLWFTYGISRDSGNVQPPLSGRFAGMRGTFVGEDLENGQPILVRHVYLNESSTVCRWEQAFSYDGGKTWETNWVITFSRVPSTVG